MKNLKIKSNTSRSFVMTIILLSILCLATSKTFSQEFEENDKTQSPYFMVISDKGDTDPLPLKNTRNNAHHL